jgi:hypothetical protein
LRAETSEQIFSIFCYYSGKKRNLEGLNVGGGKNTFEKFPPTWRNRRLNPKEGKINKLQAMI